MKSTIQRVDKEFVKYMKRIYGDLDMPVITRKHTSVLQEIWSKKKKASLYDTFYWVILIGFIGMVLLLGANFTSNVNTRIHSMSQFDSETLDMMDDMEGIYTNYIDKGFVLGFIGEIIITFILGMMLAIHPIFFVLYIPGWFFAVYLAAIISDFYQKIAQTAILAGAADMIPWTTYLLIYLPWIVGIFGLVLAIMMYRIWKVGNQ